MKRKQEDVELNVAAMLVAFVALIYLVNLGLGAFHTTLQTLLGYPLAPVAWLLFIERVI